MRHSRILEGTDSCQLAPAPSAPPRGSDDDGRPPPGRAAEVAKRGLDLVLAAVLLVVILPALVVLAFLVRATSPGGAFFLQERIGRSGRRFRIVKLRTMVADAEARLRADTALHHAYVELGYKLPPHVDPRLTRIGRFLRRTSLDELPQLINVLRGDMSLVGPRPVLAEELDTFGALKSDYLDVRPGLTGYWQVMGRSLLTASDRMEMDRYYLRNRSLGLDLIILLRTIPAALRCRGAH